MAEGRCRRLIARYVLERGGLYTNQRPAAQAFFLHPEIALIVVSGRDAIIEAISDSNCPEVR